MFFLLGSLVEETPCEHWENMQTPHRKATLKGHIKVKLLNYMYSDTFECEAKGVMIINTWTSVKYACTTL